MAATSSLPTSTKSAAFAAGTSRHAIASRRPAFPSDKAHAIFAVSVTAAAAALPRMVPFTYAFVGPKVHVHQLCGLCSLPVLEQQ